MALADVILAPNDVHGRADHPRFLPISVIATAMTQVSERLGRRPRLVLFGNYGNGNTGDEAILAGLLEVLHPCDVVVVGRDPQRIVELHGVESVATASRAGLRAVRAADVIAIGGGGIFGRGIPLLPSILPWGALLGRALGKRIVYLTIGAYSDMPRLVRTGVRLSARFSDFVSTRDHESTAMLSGRVLGADLHPIPIHDPAIGLVPAERGEVRAALAAIGVTGPGRPLGIALKPTPDPAINDRMIRSAAAAVDWWCEHRDADVVFFPFSRRGDYGLGEDLSDRRMGLGIRDRVAEPERLHVVGELPPRLLKGAIGETAGMIALRLHAQIFAHAMRVPLLGLSFERKSEAFLEQIGAVPHSLEHLTCMEIVAWLQRI